MGLAVRELRSGLVVAEEAYDEAQLSRALRQLDDRLVLQKERAPVEGGWIYRVICLINDSYAPVILTWSDEYGRPLPLGSGIIDAVRKLHPEVRERHGIVDADEHNERHVAQVVADARDRESEIIGEHRGRIDRVSTAVSMGPTSKVPYWRRNRRGPQSSGSR